MTANICIIIYGYVCIYNRDIDCIDMDIERYWQNLICDIKLSISETWLEAPHYTGRLTVRHVFRHIWLLTQAWGCMLCQDFSMSCDEEEVCRCKCVCVHVCVWQCVQGSVLSWLVCVWVCMHVCVRVYEGLGVVGCACVWQWAGESLSIIHLSWGRSSPSPFSQD